MEIRPILSALLRNRTRAVLIAMQIALTLAIVSNAAWIISQRLETMSRPTGIDVDNVIYISARHFDTGMGFLNRTRRDLEALRSLPGVASATPVFSPPLSGSGNGECFSKDPEPDAPYVCFNRNQVDEQGLATMGLKLVSGRDFTADDVSYFERNASGYSPVGIVTQALADAWFPNGDAVGRSVYSEGTGIRIVGVVERMQGPWLHIDTVEHVLLQPSISEGDRTRYLVRAEPGQRDRLIPDIEEALQKVNRDRLTEFYSQAELLARTYQDDRAMTWVLLIVVVLLISITTLGIVGLANSSVLQRTKQIGTRRALGARRRDIMRYFLVENGLVTAGGVALGALVALALNYWLVNAYELPRLKTAYVVVTIVALFVIGQLAVLAPARRAAAIDPAIATRSV